MADHKKLIPIILKWEGGWSHDPADRGGETMRGVTFDTFRFYRRRKGMGEPTPGDLRNISAEEWADIFKTLYWDRWHADSIRNQSVADILVDWVWASGVYGIKIPQRLLGVEQDGVVGEATLGAVNAAGQAVLFQRIYMERIDFVKNIAARNPSQKRFLQGWLNRINDFKFREQ